MATAGSDYNAAPPSNPEAGTRGELCEADWGEELSCTCITNGMNGPLVWECPI